MEIAVFTSALWCHFLPLLQKIFVSLMPCVCGVGLNCFFCAHIDNYVQKVSVIFAWQNVVDTLMLRCVTVERSDDPEWQATTQWERNSFLPALPRPSVQGELQESNDKCLKALRRCRLLAKLNVSTKCNNYCLHSTCLKRAHSHTHNTDRLSPKSNWLHSCAFQKIFFWNSCRNFSVILYTN